MGYIKHNAIIVTSRKVDLLAQARAKASSLGLAASPAVESPINGYSSFLVAPDGSKEGWANSAAGDAQRAALREWLGAQRYDDGSSSLEWCEVAYGSNDCAAEIAHHEWEKEPTPSADKLPEEAGK